MWNKYAGEYTDFIEDLKVNAIGINGINPFVYDGPIIFYESTFENIYGIPLTKEWLVDKLGFEKDGEHFNLKQIHIKLPECYFYSGNDHVSNGNTDAICKYVHQLQNLYNALTGKELIIK